MKFFTSEMSRMKFFTPELLREFQQDTSDKTTEEWERRLSAYQTQLDSYRQNQQLPEGWSEIIDQFVLHDGLVMATGTKTVYEKTILQQESPLVIVLSLDKSFNEKPGLLTLCYQNAKFLSVAGQDAFDYLRSVFLVWYPITWSYDELEIRSDNRWQHSVLFDHDIEWVISFEKLSHSFLPF